MQTVAHYNYTAFVLDTVASSFVKKLISYQKLLTAKV